MMMIHKMAQIIAINLLNNSRSVDKHPTDPFEHQPFWHLPEVQDGQSAPGLKRCQDSL